MPTQPPRRDAPAYDPEAIAGIYQRLDLCAPAPYTRGEYARRFLWEVAQGTIFRYSFRGAYRWRAALLRRFGARLGRHVRIRRTCTVIHPWLLEVGDWVTLGDAVEVYNLGPILIGSHTTISQGTCLCAGTHDYARRDLPLVRPPVTIGRGVWVAAQAFIGPGVTIGDNCVIGARSVVTKDIAPGTVAAGNPARVIKPRPMASSVPGLDRRAEPTG